MHSDAIGHQTAPRKIYVSSTLLDLRGERDTVFKWLNGARHLPYHSYVGDSDTVSGSCLRDIEQCDLYVLILGHRYGEPLKQNNPDNLSMTHMEFRHAGAKRIPQIALLRDSIPDIALSDFPSFDRVNAFRSEVEQTVRPARFKDEATLLQALSTSVQSELDKLLAASASNKSAELAREDRGYRWPQALDFEVYMNAKRESFTGRAWLFKEIQTWLASESGSRALLIKADPGVGKSAFMSEYVARSREKQVLAWHFCRHDRPETLQPGGFVRSVAAQLASLLPEYQQSIESSPDLQKALDEADARAGSALETAVLAPLAKLAEPEGARLLVVDALDESLDVPDGAGLVQLLEETAGYFPPWLRLLATSRPVPEVLVPLQTAFRPQEIVADAAPNLEDLRQYVLGNAARKGIREAVEADGRGVDFLVNLLCDKDSGRSGGKFLFVRHALRELADGTLTIATLEELPPEGMDGFYRVSFRRRFGRKGEKYGALRAVLGVMCAAHEPLSSSELAQILGVKEALVVVLRNQLADFIRLSTDERVQLSFEHQSLKEWLTLKKEGLPRAAEFAVDLTQSHAQIHRWARKRVETGDAYMSPYLLRYLATHLKDNAEQQAVYVQLLLKCFEWSQAQLDLNGVSGLWADVEHLGGHLEAPWLRALIRQSEPALRESTAQWPAQVLGRLGTRSWNIGLESLATAAQRWALNHGDSHAALLPLRRSLPWRSQLGDNSKGKVRSWRCPEGV